MISRIPSRTHSQPDPDPARKDPLKQVAKDLQGVFLFQLLQEMRASVPETSLTAEGEDVFQQMMDQELADRLSDSLENTGLVRSIHRQLARKAGLNFSPESPTLDLKP